jgi:hypothetical protein
MSAKIKTVDGIDIFVTDDGKFEARIGEDKPIRRSSLAAVVNEIQKRRGGLTVQIVSTSRLSSRRRKEKKIIAYVNYHKVRYDTGELDHLYSEDPFVCTPKQIEQIDALIAEQRALDERWGDMLDSLTKVTQTNFNSLQQQAEGEQA